MKKSVLAASMVTVLFAAAGNAELVDVTLAGAIGHVEASTTIDAFSGVEREYIDSFDVGSTFSFTFRYESETQPTSTESPPLNSMNDFATYTTGVSLREGRVGSFTDFNDWQLSLTLATLWSHGGYDLMRIDLVDPASSRVANFQFNWNVIGGYLGRDVFSPSSLPNAKTLDGPVNRNIAQFEVRQDIVEYLIYQNRTEDFPKVVAVTAVPEPQTVALWLGSLILFAQGRRKRC